MPPLVRRYLKTAIGYLMFGLGLGLYMLVRRELGGVWPTLWWVSAHTHAILVGFVMMMILGVALWMFPRPGRDDRQFDTRKGGGRLLVHHPRHRGPARGRVASACERRDAGAVGRSRWRGRPDDRTSALLLCHVEPHSGTPCGGPVHHSVGTGGPLIA